VFVNAFLATAEEIFSTARQGAGEECDYSVLVHRGGAIHVIADSDWHSDALLAHHGAETVYRIRRGASHVTVEARRGSESCRLSSARPGRALSSACDFPRYSLVPGAENLLPR
jgi:hypothetical protein